MYLVTKLSKRTKTISWFLLHVFVLQIIPFSSFASRENRLNNVNANEIGRSNLIERMLAWSAPLQNEEEKSPAKQFAIKSKTVISTPNSVALKAVSSSSGGFTPGSMNDMVDPFTGDFSYTIPLMDVDGYPLTLSYNSNVNMNSEATWVGLGWNLDVGSISREMRGIPDEFNGDQMLATTFKIKEDKTTDGFKAGGYLSIDLKKVFLSPKLQVTALWGNYTNSYLGLGKTFDAGLQASVSLSYSNDIGVNAGAKFGIGYSSDTKGGVGFNKTFGFSAGLGPDNNSKGINGGASYTYGTNFNSRSGLISKTQAFNVSAGYTTSTYIPNSKKGVRDGHDGSGSGASYGASSSVTFGTATSVPKLRTNTISESSAFLGDLYVGFNLGPAIMKVGGILETYETSARNAGSSNLYNQPAYGYMHTGKRAGETRSYAVMDFDRGSDFNFSERMRDLPFSVQSFDIFHVSSSGLNAQFRANRTDVGTFYDATTRGRLNEGSELLVDDDITGVNAGVLLGAGITVEVGYSTGIQQGEIKSGKWGSPLNFPTVAAGKKFDPTVYFKAIGELTPNDLTIYNTLGGKSAAHYKLAKSGSDLTTTSNLSTGEAVYGPLNGTIPTRATVFEPKTASEMAAAPEIFNRKIRYFSNTGVPVTEERNEGVKSDNDISSIKVISTSGGVYTYGLPNYSLSSSDVSFSIANVGGRTYNDSRGEVTYFSGDAGTANSLGKAQMFDKTTVPAYASSYMLTSIVGSDYIDVNNNGPSVDDIGSYHQFNYVKYYGENNPYKWRFPVSGGPGSSNPKAILNKGYLSLDSDDIATYSYSEREVYYPLNIRGKNYIAVFTLEDRKDAYGVSSENGFLNENMPLKCLDKITLYSLSDYSTNGNNAVKLQVVDFEYDYSLCLQAPNNKETYSNPASLDNGKLTLRRIRTYSGSSKEMGLSAIEFTYNNERDTAYSYNHLNVDRWGNYKQNNPNLPNNLYPYAIQNQSTANANASLWKLSAVKTPSGGEMSITYEADSYGFVQNKRAMRQFQIEGMINLFQYQKIMNQSNWEMSNPLYALSDQFRADNYDPDIHLINPAFFKKYGKFQKNFVPNNIIVFKLDQPIDAVSTSKSDANQKIKDLYFKDGSGYLKQLYFNMYAKIKTSGGTALNEMIPCFVDIAEDYPGLFQVFNVPGYDNRMISIGAMPPPTSSTSYEYGYVVLDLINVGKIEETKKKEKKDEDILMMNPIQRFGVDFIRQNLPDIVYGACTTCEGELSVDKKALFGKEMYKYIIDQGGYLRSFTPARSFVRLYEPDNIKMGGNARVTSIVLNDKWVEMSNEEANANGTYAWSYSYPSRSKSLGVASYEPAIGMDENPFYSWHSYYNFAKKFPDEMNFHVTPLARQLYPDPVVGYEEVQVSMSGGSAGSKGKVVLKFHTNKDPKYVTVADATSIKPCDPVIESSFFTGKTVDKYGFSQGYSVITNDFHGKPYDITLNDNNENIISNTAYEYYNLGEAIPMIDRKGRVRNQNVAQEFDIHLDSRFVYDESRFQMAGLTVGFTFPTFKVSFGPFYTQNSRERGFYSLSLMKHLNYSAVVKKITTTYLGSSNTAENMLYDQYSGEVVLSSLQDEYDDRLYNLAYPSHWAHPSLREIQTTYPTSSSGTINNLSGQLTTTFDMTEFYSPGDLIELTNGSVTGEGYILSISPGTTSGSTAYIVTTNGPAFNLISGPVTFSVKEPNRTNRISETMQSIVRKKPFVVTPDTDFAFPVGAANGITNEEIIEGSAITYRDKDNLGECSIKPDNQYHNLFGNGAKGDLVTETMLSWQSERKQEVHNHKTRFDGAYADFNPFYSLDANKVWTRIDKANYPYSGNGTLQKWRTSGIASRYNKFGNAYEMRDVLGNFAAVATISNNKIFSLPVAQAVNANATDIAFDGFEPYTYQVGFAYDNYFMFLGINPANLVSTVRHSGKTSLRVNPSIPTEFTTTTVATCPIEERTNTDIPQGYLAGSCNCPPPLFNPTPGEYVFGAWIKQTGSGATVKVVVGSEEYEAVQAGPVIEGWQRFEGTCDIPSGPVTISLILKNNSGADAYFDDFRFHPFAAAMTTTVYDAQSFLPIATHDGNNYTTFYNYDENLQLVRVKVETTEGIKTVSETKFGLSTK